MNLDTNQIPTVNELRAPFIRRVVRLVSGCSIVLVLIASLLMPLLSASVTKDRRARRLARLMEKLIPLHETMAPMQSGDWLASHPESGQTFAAYVASKPNRLTRQRDKLYVQPLGQFDEKQKKIVELSAEYLGIFFGCETELLDPLGLEVMPESARRVHPSWGVRQILSTHVLDEVLKPRVPHDAVAMIALTTSDLYPADDWNFVFGQASLHNRVGVWSLFRMGDPDTEMAKVLSRTLATASHETGHMFSMAHCIAYECSMCGSNGLEESDRRPMALCPECVAKVWWATKVDPVKRYRQLQAFCQKHGQPTEAAFFEKSLQALTVDDPPKMSKD